MATTTISSIPAPPRPHWMTELDGNSTSSSQVSSKIANPPGFAARVVKSGKSSKQQALESAPRKAPTQAETDTLKLKKAWEVAIAPAKQLPMNAIGMYMSGSSLQIFSIMMVFMLFKGPLTAILSIPQTFARFETPRTAQRMIVVKLAYVGCNLLLLALGVWKVDQMGLLPTTRSDWLGWERERVSLERGVRAGST